MPDLGPPLGFRAPDAGTGSERDGWRLLAVLLGIVLLGAAAFAAINFGLA